MALRLMLMALLAGSLALSACGRKGDPIRPDTEQEEKKDG